MKKAYTSIVLPAMLTLSIFTSPLSYAIPNLSSEVNLTVDSTTLTDNDSSIGGATNASEQFIDSIFGGEVIGQAAANSAGVLGVTSAFIGANGSNANVSSTASWTETFIGTSNDSFTFTIPEATLAFDANNVLGFNGMLEVSILLNNVAIFSSITNVTTASPFLNDPSDFNVTQSGTVLTSVFSNNINTPYNISGAASGFVFTAFSDTLNLASNVGGNNTLRYEMTASVDGGLVESAALASIGDPLNLNQFNPVALSQSTTPVSVSEPNALILFFLSLFVFVLRSRR